MIFTKDLVIKGLLGLGVCIGGTTAILLHKRQKNQSTEGEQSESEWIKNFGLVCGDGNIGSSGTECTITPEKLNVKLDDTKKSEGLSRDSAQSSSGKIKVYKEGEGSEYNKNFKFVVEGGYITLTGGNPASQITKLEEFETYELKETSEEGESKKYFLTRKTEGSKEIKKALGLPDTCEFPNNSNDDKSCSNINAEQLKTINFEGKKDGGATFENNSGTASFSISKITKNEYPLGLKFIFSPGGRIIFSSNPESSLGANIDAEFKIKKQEGKLSLERAWDLDTLAAQVGLENCSKDDTCTIKTNDSLKVKHDDKKEENKTKSGSTAGKIKVYKGTARYKEGFKFVIEEGDIELNSSGNQITKLEEFETYEIEEDGDKYYLSRKSSSGKEKGKLLDFPSGCDLPESSETTTCSALTAEKLKGMNFEGKGSGDVTISNGSGSGSNINLKISKTTEQNKSHFPLGYKFVLESNKDITFPKGSSSEQITIKANTNTEFKIKKGSDKRSLALEKAWSVTELAKKVGLTCSDNKECTFESSKVNVYGGESDKVENASVKDNNNNDKKMKYEEDQEGHNQGFKFFVDGESDFDLEVTGSSDKKIEKKGSATYEIKEMSGKWYLCKKAVS